MKTFLPLFLLLALVFPMRALAEGPQDRIRSTADALIAILEDPEMTQAERYERITTLVKAGFHFPAMSRVVLGVHWRRAEPAQRERFIELFAEFLEASYRERIETYMDEYTNEEVRYLSERIEGDRAEVETAILTKNAEIPVVYRLLREAGEWRVYDVVIEGVSLVRTYRSTFGEIARSEGIDGLLERLQEKVRDLEETLWRVIGSAVCFCAGRRAAVWACPGRCEASPWPLQAHRPPADAVLCPTP